MAPQRPETELLLCCARASIDSKTRARIQTLLQRALQWDHLRRLAQDHRVLPALYRNLTQLAPPTLPRVTLASLRADFHANAWRSFFLTRELLKLLHLLQTNDIAAIPYKGPTLAASLYGKLALRQFNDLDILIRRRDFPKVKNLFINNGYRPHLPLTPRQEASRLRRHHEYAFVRADDRVFVEIHWGVTKSVASFPIDFEHLWRHRQTISLLGTPISSFSPEDLLLILCVHGYKHRWTHLNWICDIAQLIHAHAASMNWHRVMRQAACSGGERILFVGLLLAKELLEAQVPKAVLTQMQADSAAKWLAMQVCERLFSRTDQGLGGLEQAIYHLRMRERLSDRLNYFFRHFLRNDLPQLVVPNPKDRSLLALPVFPSFLCCLRRPFRLLKEYGLSPFRHLIRSLAGRQP